MTRRLRPPGLEALFVATVALFGFRLGAQPISDNSMFVHLRTGIDMAAGLGIPREDPYSFTAGGEPWVVQSWLASWTYGWADRIGGGGLVVLEQAVLMGVLAWLVVRLARAGSPLRTAAAGVIAVGVGAPYWTPRPLLFGLVAFALLVTIVERRHSPWWLVPVVWVWVNTHGSFPLGVLWLGARVVGEGLDRRRLPSELWPYGGAFLAGLAVSVANPLGPRLLLFPLTVGDKREIFSTVIEWHTPDFQTASGLFSLVFVTLAVLVLFRARVAWGQLVPAVGFLAMGLLALRNVPVAAIALAPALGRALAAERVPDARAARAGPPRLNMAFAAVLGAAFVLFGLQPFAGKAIDASAYPVAATAAIERMGLRGDGHRIAQQDVVGCYLILRDGRDAQVFVDDRVDMYPVAVSNDYAALLAAEPGALDVLDRWEVDVVLWERERPLATVLAESEDWRRVYRRGDWVVFQRVAPAPGRPA